MGNKCSCFWRYSVTDETFEHAVGVFLSVGIYFYFKKKGKVQVYYVQERGYS